jgi:N-acetylneuraminate synthase
MLTIAEIGQAHEGSLGIAHSYIDAIADTGVNAIKWQTHIAEAESSIHEPFRVKFSYEDETRMDYWKRMEFTLEQWREIKDHCEQKGLEFMSSPFSLSAVDLLEEIGVYRYKIGSGEVSNFLMLDKIARTGKPIILSSGMSSFKELDSTVEFLKPFNNHLTILQCTTAYPTAPIDWGLNVIGELKDRYSFPVGFSDHSGDIHACLAATALGASVLEFHVVFDKRMFGPDAKASLTVDQVAGLVAGVHAIESSLQHPVDKLSNKRFDKLKGIFEKSLALNTGVTKGDILTEEMLEAKKPKSLGIDAALYQQVIGKKVNKDMVKWDFLTEEDIGDE